MGNMGHTRRISIGLNATRCCHRASSTLMELAVHRPPPPLRRRRVSLTLRLTSSSGAVGPVGRPRSRGRGGGRRPTVSSDVRHRSPPGAAGRCNDVDARYGGWLHRSRRARPSPSSSTRPCQPYMAVRTGGVTGGETWLEVGDRGPGLPASVVAHLMRGTGPDALRAFSSTGQAGSACGSRVRWRRKTAAASRSPTPVRRGRACGSSSAPAGRCRCEPGNWATNRETRRFVSASHGKNRRFSAPFRRRCHRLLAGRPRPPARPLWPIRNVA